MRVVLDVPIAKFISVFTRKENASKSIIGKTVHVYQFLSTIYVFTC